MDNMRHKILYMLVLLLYLSDMNCQLKGKHLLPFIIFSITHCISFLAFVLIEACSDFLINSTHSLIGVSQILYRIGLEFTLDLVVPARIAEVFEMLRFLGERVRFSESVQFCNRISLPLT